MPFIRVVVCLVVSAIPISLTYAQDDPFKAPVRPTEPLSPQDELKTFKVPEGFEVQLFASDPDLLKPMNLAFDAKGRLWASMSREYPYAAPLDQPGRDAIKILEDTDGDGTADKITTFADGLNIPIGLYPYKNGVIAWSIPNIWYFEDTDGDDKADKRTILYGPMGFERDTHGMNNGFTRGFDGWLYACHGFNNQTTVKGADGHEISMQSGNTYRMRLHGERIEQYTWGQVNPFGMTIDEYGYLFTADCHSKPIYQLVREGYYPSFGKPHDGLGFVPQMMDHSHGSTAIAGVAIVSGEGFPEEYRGDAYTGNVMTSRINRDRLDRIGASVKAVEQPDFLSTTDPWFRPVDLQYGPDDALYVADFYNKIIGHYEVPLDHPGRDRTSGRIWRIVYTGKNAAGSANRLRDLTQHSTEQLIERLSSENLTERMLITDYLSDTVGQKAIALCRKAIRSHDSPFVRLHSLWVLSRLNALQPDEIVRLAKDSDPQVRSHALQAAEQFPVWLPEFEELGTRGIRDEHSFVKKAAVELLKHHPHRTSLDELLKIATHPNKARRPDSDDVILNHTWKIGLKNQLQDDSVFPDVTHYAGRPNTVELLAEICLAVPGERSADFLFGALELLPEGTLDTLLTLQHIAANLRPGRTGELIHLVRTRAEGNLGFQIQQLGAIEAGFDRRNQPRPDSLKDWANELVVELLDTAGDSSRQWSNRPLPGATASADPWDLQTRPCADGVTRPLLSSHPHGEQLTGVLRSPVFDAPKEFQFYGCGHRGYPDQEALDVNFYRLRDAETNELLREERPPRSDTAQLFTWELAELDHRPVVFEIVDGDSGGAYAWIAAGRFDPPVIQVPEMGPRAAKDRLVTANSLIGRYKLEQHRTTIAAQVKDSRQQGPVRMSAANALDALDPVPMGSVLIPLLGETNVKPDLSDRIAALVLRENAPNEASLDTLFADTFAAISGQQQLQLAQRMVTSKPGAERLLALAEQGKASPRLLQNRSILLAIEAAKPESAAGRIQEITRGLPSVNQELRELIALRLERYPSATLNIERGRAVFEKNCKNCHRIGDQGELVGPQLDGIGNRGLNRILEDVLDPNQNVDVAFHTMTIVLSDGKVLTGLFRREENGNWVLADNKGKEFRVAAADIEESAKSPLSLMPENVAREFKPEEFFDLIGYLLEQTAKPAPSPE